MALLLLRTGASGLAPVQTAIASTISSVPPMTVPAALRVRQKEHFRPLKSWTAQVAAAPVGLVQQGIALLAGNSATAVRTSKPKKQDPN
jgi:hypothetical protein